MRIGDNVARRKRALEVILRERGIATRLPYTRLIEIAIECVREKYSIAEEELRETAELL